MAASSTAMGFDKLFFEISEVRQVMKSLYFEDLSFVSKSERAGVRSFALRMLKSLSTINDDISAADWTPENLERFEGRLVELGNYSRSRLIVSEGKLRLR